MKSLEQIHKDNEDAILDYIDDVTKPLLGRVKAWLEIPDNNIVRGILLLTEYVEQAEGAKHDI